jgi:hypothetical protein
VQVVEAAPPGVEGAQRGSHDVEVGQPEARQTVAVALTPDPKPPSTARSTPAREPFWVRTVVGPAATRWFGSATVT